MTTASVTIDVDGVAGLPNGGNGYGERLSSRSERLYGIHCGLPRILDVLDEAGVTATFYVPGVTALAHRAAIRDLAASRHEIGHHGHSHRRLDQMSVDEQREDLRLGLEAIEDVTGSRPSGYRAPAWELTPATVRLLAEEKLSFDSSLMGADAPYRLEETALVELPVHWSLDDAPYFAGHAAIEGLLGVWRSELALAVAERRHVTYTVHPEITGRPHRVDLLRRTLDAGQEAGVRWTPHSVAARSVPDG